MSVGAVALRCALHRLRAGRVVLALACLAAALVAAGQCASLVSSLAWYVPGGADDYTALLGQGNGLVAGLGDFLAYLVLGRAQPAPSSGAVAVREVMQIPFGWLVCVLLPVVVTAILAGSEGGRAPVLVASGSRVGDWLGRCLATLVGCALVWAALVLVCAIATFALGGELTLRASEWFCDVAAIARETMTAPPYEVGPAFAGAVAVSGALSLVQLAVAELVGAPPGVSRRGGCGLGVDLPDDAGAAGKPHDAGEKLRLCGLPSGGGDRRAPAGGNRAVGLICHGRGAGRHRARRGRGGGGLAELSGE